MRDYRLNGFVFQNVDSIGSAFRNVDSIRGLVYILPQFVTLLSFELYYGRLSIARIANLPSRIIVEGRGRRGRGHDGGCVPDGAQSGRVDVLLPSVHPFPC